MILETLMNSIILMAILMAVGYYLRSKSILNDDAENSLSFILVNITIPAMVIKAMYIKFSFEQVKTGVSLLGIAIIFHIILVALGNLGTIGTKDEEKKKMFKFTVPMMNCGFMGFPLVNQLYGNGAMFYATMFQTPNIILMWTYGMAIMIGKDKGKSNVKDILLNPGMIGIYVGLFLYITQIKLPMFATNLMDLLNNVTTVLAMIIIGSKIKTMGVRDSIVNRQAYYATFFRLVLSPLIMILIFKFLDFEPMIEQIFIIYAALPVATLMPILAQRYGSDGVFGSKIVVITHLFSLVTIPLFFWLYTVI
ncbi:AEC family transporter [Sedimentibacter sp. B4]|uniref:AEC family transporter n=1 Tax=Sedimentibacter sp. B4 TaxID=304766 RepID=UPI0002D259A0|nr:AEC family transporter [Sedimentibacter sp. B4]